MEDVKAHATLSASGSATWLNCPGSVKMQEGIPRTSSVYAEEGTAAHAFAEDCLRRNVDADQLIGQTYNGFEATLGMAEYVQEYLDFVRGLQGHLEIEQRVNYSLWTPGYDSFGTADAVILKDGVCYVVDLKYGKGVRVEADVSSQLMLYGLGVLNEFSSLFDIKTVVLTIVQPRLDHVSERTISTADLLAWGERVMDAALATTKEADLLVPGDLQCRWCAAKDRCKALAEFNLKQINEGFDSVDEPGERKNINELTPGEISVILKNIDGVTKWAKDLQTYAHQLLETGQDVPDFKLVLGRSLRKWVDEEAAGKALSRKLSKKEAFTEKVISPAQAEKLLGKDSLIIKKHAFKPEGKPTIAPLSDKRPAIETNIAEGFDCLGKAA